MKSFKKIVFILFTTIFFSCEKTELAKVSNIEDYNIFLKNTTNNKTQILFSQANFWNIKLTKTPNQYPYNAKLANNQSELFSITGNINQLKEAERNLIIANEKVNYTNCNYLRSLARNYISQHRFKESLSLLEKAEKIGAQLQSTRFILVDVYLELGNYPKAEKYLVLIKDTTDFNYLIRASKYNDHKGNLDLAISYLEQSLAIAKSINDQKLLQWNYTNLADYYGHAGRIQDSYDSYLKALEIDPNNAYAKKGISWIVFSYERNPEEALRILQTVSKENTSPDYYLLMADIAEYQNKMNLRESYLNTYFEAIQNPNYGVMYNSYNIELFANAKGTKLKAIEIAKMEVSQRPTAQSYDLLAWAYFKNGDKKRALEITEKFVMNHTFEPVALLHTAQILKANGKTEEVKPLKEELLGSIYELGPLAEQEINNI